MTTIRERWAAYKAAQAVQEIQPPDYSFVYPEQGWLQVWEVEWAGGVLALPHALTGDQTLTVELQLRAAAIDSVAAHEGVSATLIDVYRSSVGVWNDQWGDSGNANGSTVAAGHYWLVAYLPEQSERALLAPVLPDGMLWSPRSSSGTSVAPADLARAEYRTLFQSLAASDQFAWTFNSGGDDANRPLDLTDPANPTVVTAGVYSFSITVRADAAHAGATFRAYLSLDDSGFGWLAEQSVPLDSSAPKCNVASTVYLPSGAVVPLYTTHDIGSAANFSMWATVQRLI